MTCLPHLCNKELFNPLRVLQHTELQSQSGMPVLQGIQTGPKAKKGKVHQNKQVLVSSQSWYDPATSSSMSRRPWSVTRMRARPRFIYTQQDEPTSRKAEVRLISFDHVWIYYIYIYLSCIVTSTQYRPIWSKCKSLLALRATYQLLCFGATKTVTETPSPCRKPTRAVCLCSSRVLMVSFTEPLTNWTYNSSSLQETFIRQAVNCFKQIVSSGGRWYPESAIPYLWDYMSSVCIPKLKFLRGASNLDIYTIRTNKNTKLAACASKVHWASCLCSAQTVLPSEANPRFNSNRHADYTQCSWTYTEDI